ncbi:MAG: hypothetical protein IH986_18690 [Planctomycetes bacterium]|nr:hypothetical protein [Planctomycetota bacterium]
MREATDHEDDAVRDAVRTANRQNEVHADARVAEAVREAQREWEAQATDAPAEPDDEETPELDDQQRDLLRGFAREDPKTRAALVRRLGHALPPDTPIIHTAPQWPRRGCAIAAALTMVVSLCAGWGLRGYVDSAETAALLERSVELAAAGQVAVDMIGILRTQEVKDPEEWFPVIEGYVDQLAKAIAEFQGVQ